MCRRRGAVVDLARKGRRFPALLFVGKLIASDVGEAVVSLVVASSG